MRSLTVATVCLTAAYFAPGWLGIALAVAAVVIGTRAVLVMMAEEDAILADVDEAIRGDN